MYRRVPIRITMIPYFENPHILLIPLNPKEYTIWPTNRTKMLIEEVCYLVLCGIALFILFNSRKYAFPYSRLHNLSPNSCSFILIKKLHFVENFQFVLFYFFNSISIDTKHPFSAQLRKIKLKFFY